MTNNPFLTAILGDFNAKSSLWYNNNITTYEGSKIDGVTSQFGSQQIIKEPTHLVVYRPNLYNSTKLLMESGVHSSLHFKLSSPHNVCKIQS